MLDDPRLDELARSHLRDATTELADVRADVSLAFGFLGVAWCLAHFQALDGETDPEAFIEIDGVVQRLVSRDDWPLHFDLLNGLVGLMVYALERESTPILDGVLRRAVTHLMQFARVDAGGLGWFTPPTLLSALDRAHHPSGQYNLGPAHGQVAIIATLARLAGERGLVDGALVRRATAWLLAQRRSAEPGDVEFPAVISHEGERRFVRRIGWCYGDGASACAVLAAARVLADPELAALGRTLAVRSATVAAAVADASLCHGAAGTAYTLVRLAELTGDAGVAVAAARWYRTLLTMFDPKAGAGGFVFSHYDYQRGELFWGDDVSFLNGCSGVGLVLLAALSDAPRGWHRLLAMG